jgi:hypothetical protein
MVHGALFVGLLFSRFKKSTDAGKAYRMVKQAKLVTSAFVRKEKLKKLRRELELGINREEAYRLKTRGTVEVLLPARMQPDDVPAGFEAKEGVKLLGSFIFKVSEWNELWEWIAGCLAKGTEFERPIGRDGRWLLIVGRRRWRDDEVRKQAWANAAKVPQIWESSEMWSKNSEG